MEKTKKALTEDEVNTKLRLGAKVRILALMDAGKMDSSDKDFKAHLQAWKQVQTDMIHNSAQRSHQLRILKMMSKEDQQAVLKTVKPLLLTG